MELYVRVRRACMVKGMSTREAARVFGLHRDTVRKMLVRFHHRLQESERATEPRTNVCVGHVCGGHNTGNI